MGGLSMDSKKFIEMRVGDVLIVDHLPRTSWSKSHGTCHGLGCHVYQKFKRVSQKHCLGTHLVVRHADKQNPKVAVVIKTNDTVPVPGSLCFRNHI